MNLQSIKALQEQLDSLQRVQGNPEGPKRPLAPFFLYKSEVYKTCKNENPDKSMAELTKIIANQWKNENSVTKERMEQQHKELKKKYEYEVHCFEKAKRGNLLTIEDLKISPTVVFSPVGKQNAFEMSNLFIKMINTPINNLEYSLINRTYCIEFQFNSTQKKDHFCVMEYFEENELKKSSEFQISEISEKIKEFQNKYEVAEESKEEEKISLLYGQKSVKIKIFGDQYPDLTIVDAIHQDLEILQQYTTKDTIFVVYPSQNEDFSIEIQRNVQTIQPKLEVVDYKQCQLKNSEDKNRKIQYLCLFQSENRSIREEIIVWIDIIESKIGEEDLEGQIQQQNKHQNQQIYTNLAKDLEQIMEFQHIKKIKDLKQKIENYEKQLQNEKNENQKYNKDNIFEVLQENQIKFIKNCLRKQKQLKDRFYDQKDEFIEKLIKSYDKWVSKNSVAHFLIKLMEKTDKNKPFINLDCFKDFKIELLDIFMQLSKEYLDQVHQKMKDFVVFEGEQMQIKWIFQQIQKVLMEFINGQYEKIHIGLVQFVESEKIFPADMINVAQGEFCQEYDLDYKQFIKLPLKHFSQIQCKSSDSSPLKIKLQQENLKYLRQALDFLEEENSLFMQKPRQNYIMIVNLIRQFDHIMLEVIDKLKHFLIKETYFSYYHLFMDKIQFSIYFDQKFINQQIQEIELEQQQFDEKLEKIKNFKENFEKFREKCQKFDFFVQFSKEIKENEEINHIEKLEVQEEPLFLEIDEILRLVNYSEKNLQNNENLDSVHFISQNNSFAKNQNKQQDFQLNLKLNQSSENTRKNTFLVENDDKNKYLQDEIKINQKDQKNYQQVSSENDKVNFKTAISEYVDNSMNTSNFNKSQPLSNNQNFSFKTENSQQIQQNFPQLKQFSFITSENNTNSQNIQQFSQISIENLQNSPQKSENLKIYEKNNLNQQKNEQKELQYGENSENIFSTSRFQTFNQKQQQENEVNDQPTKQVENSSLGPQKCQKENTLAIKENLKIQDVVEPLNIVKNETESNQRTNNIQDFNKFKCPEPTNNVFYKPMQNFTGHQNLFSNNRTSYFQDQYNHNRNIFSNNSSQQGQFINIFEQSSHPFSASQQPQNSFNMFGRNQQMNQPNNESGQINNQINLFSNNIFSQFTNEKNQSEPEPKFQKFVPFNQIFKNDDVPISQILNNNEEEEVLIDNKDKKVNSCGCIFIVKCQPRNDTDGETYQCSICVDKIATAGCGKEIELVCGVKGQASGKIYLCDNCQQKSKKDSAEKNEYLKSEEKIDWHQVDEITAMKSSIKEQNNQQRQHSISNQNNQSNDIFNNNDFKK